MYEIEVWVFVDEEGNCGVGRDPDAAVDDYKNCAGDDLPIVGRAIKVTLTVPAPVALELRGTVPPEPQQGTLTVK